jgi:toxin ParE1/3/4
MNRLLLVSEAYGDIDDAVAWYEKRRTGLGDQFLKRLRECVEKVLEAPERNAILTQNYRRARVSRFPYVVIYDFDAGYVTVYAVTHTSRDARAWQDRLP